MTPKTPSEDMNWKIKTRSPALASSVQPLPSTWNGSTGCFKRRASYQSQTICDIIVAAHEDSGVDEDIDIEVVVAPEGMTSPRDALDIGEGLRDKHEELESHVEALIPPQSIVHLFELARCVDDLL
eukprot:CAMPEP_0180519686 /NCGR_PEP_ID=MMETSP1036_2-20121128/55836_1 /TAXON_ID=632150 /ORGANISM="Azadinium spinosum, Strain 3D9" /LENGTH=125 /DNA_ID=CAMNT_0022532073 /DNA_START=137 /DNA_END=513 /DNA_ORIENTATION=+